MSDVLVQKLDEQSKEYKHILKITINGWKHSNKKKPRITRVMKIMRSFEFYKPYLDYLRVKGGEHLLFHGTLRSCLIAETDFNSGLCTLPDCAICGIIQNSFNIAFSGQRNGFRRFGRAIYTSACTSKADDYVSNGHNAAKQKVLLLCRIAVGKPYKTKQNQTNLMDAPSGFDSVYGKPGRALNFEETAVYNNDAIRPAYLVVYEVV